MLPKFRRITGKQTNWKDSPYLNKIIIETEFEK